MADPRVELQAEVDVPREALFGMVATAEGLAAWLDEVEFRPEVGAHIGFLMREARATGEVLAVDPPQHVSWSIDWPDEPIGTLSVVAFDLVDHGHRTHITVRQVGFRTRAQRDLHEELWRYWFARLLEAARREVGADVTAAGASTARGTSTGDSAST
ncbi:MAG: SRPBCC domain-containing protein [Chloroflexota bacterium]|nr:SRPBCC domain-containing protein [Chloroflexota bacterium]